MKEKEKRAHMQSAFNYAELSHCNKRKVGCVIVKDDRIISIGYNGTPPGWDNCCEQEYDDSKTKPEVIHAEMNAIAKLARSHESGEGASVFISYRPCFTCATLLAAVGVKDVYYAEKHRLGKADGLEHLHECGIHTEHLPRVLDNKNNK